MSNSASIVAYGVIGMVIGAALNGFIVNSVEPAPTPPKSLATELPVLRPEIGPVWRFYDSDLGVVCWMRPSTGMACLPLHELPGQDFINRSDSNE